MVFDCGAGGDTLLTARAASAPSARMTALVRASTSSGRTCTAGDGGLAGETGLAGEAEGDGMTIVGLNFAAAPAGPAATAAVAAPAAGGGECNVDGEYGDEEEEAAAPTGFEIVGAETRSGEECEFAGESGAANAAGITSGSGLFSGDALPPFILFSIPATMLATRELRPDDPSPLRRPDGDDEAAFRAAGGAAAGETDATGLELFSFRAR